MFEEMTNASVLSEKKPPLRFDEIFKFYLKLVSTAKKVWRFRHNCVAFSEYMNFIIILLQ